VALEDSLQGGQGPRGATGVTGQVGATGVTGATGVAGISASGRIWYFTQINSDITGYESLVPDSPDSAPQDDMTAVTTSSSGEVLIEEFATVAGDPNLEELPTGEYEIRFWSYVSSNDGDTRLVFRVYRRSTGGTETELFYVISPEINATTASYYNQIIVNTQPNAIDPTDRIVTKVYAKTTSTSNITAHFVHSGNTPSSWKTAITLGYVGPQGATGPTGVQGPTGPIGITGATGPEGPTGATGVAGPTGASGVIGVSGATGATGVVGVSGATGVVGVCGATGATGVAGIDGATGATGVAGGPGATGATGVVGVTGATGVVGATGATGATGVVGVTGATGVQGATGVTGATGATGATGVVGDPGATGATGATGVVGVTGATGVVGVTGATGVVGITGATGVGFSDGDKGEITVSNSGATWTIDNNVVTNAKLSQVATGTFKGRTTAATGNVEDLTGTQATALLDIFTSAAKGLAPLSGGGTANFLRADATWAVPVDNQLVSLTSTQQSTSTALANVTQLVVTLAANATYHVDCFVAFQSAATTTGLNLGFTSPTGCNPMVEIVVPIASTAVASALRTTFPNAASTTSGSVLGTGVTAINSNHTARISGIIKNGATAGNFQVQFATEVSASAITLQIGSTMRLTRVA
jgi:hypothetical protein